MIYTVTFNPSLDYVIQVDDLTLGEVNRTTSEKIYPGGKGNNVSVILSNLGHKSKALGFRFYRRADGNHAGRIRMLYGFYPAGRRADQNQCESEIK